MTCTYIEDREQENGQQFEWTTYSAKQNYLLIDQIKSFNVFKFMILFAMK